MPDHIEPANPQHLSALALVDELRTHLELLTNDAAAVAVASLSPATRLRLSQLLESSTEAAPAAYEQLAGDLDADSLARVLVWLNASRGVRRLLDELERRLRDGDIA